MTTLADITLRVAHNAVRVYEGTATGGSTSTLVDTKLTQPAGTFDNGTLWILSGTHSGKIFPVTSFKSNTLSFTAVVGEIAAGVRYAVLAPTVPYEEVRRAVNDTLESFLAESTDDTLTGDGETLIFDLPADVYNVRQVFLGSTINDEIRRRSTHCREENGVIRFDPGYAPVDGAKIYLHYFQPHSELVDYDDETDHAVNVKWLEWNATVNLLHWMYREYKDDVRFGIPTLLERAIQNSAKHRARKTPVVVVNTAVRK